jgi:hypothetical protein
LDEGYSAYTFFQKATFAWIDGKLGKGSLAALTELHVVPKTNMRRINWQRERGRSLIGPEDLAYFVLSLAKH